MNCYYNGSKVDLSKEHSDIDYVRVFCTENISMVRLDKGLICCAKWEHIESRKSIEDINGEDLWNLTDEVIDKLDEHDGKLSIDEIREIIGE